MGNKIKDYREAAGLSQGQLAEKSGIPAGTIKNWEQGRRIPRDVYQIHAVAVALGVSIENLLNL